MQEGIEFLCRSAPTKPTAPDSGFKCFAGFVKRNLLSGATAVHLVYFLLRFSSRLARVTNDQFVTRANPFAKRNPLRLSPFGRKKPTE
jgi:hypothetical protein